MFADTITIVDNADSRVLKRIDSSNPYSSEYRLTLTTHRYILNIRHTETKASANKTAKIRHNVELIKETFPPVGSTAPSTFRKTYFVDETEVNEVSIFPAVGLFNWAVASSGAVLTQLVAGES